MWDSICKNNNNALKAPRQQTRHPWTIDSPSVKSSQAMHLSVCLSVCLSDTSRCSTKSAKLRITQTTITIAQGLSFSEAKDLCEIQPGSPLTGAPNASDFWQITGYFSKTVKDRHTVSIEVEWEVVCALSNGGITHDLECPLCTPNYQNLYIVHRHSYLRNGWTLGLQFWYIDLPYQVPPCR